MRMTAGACASTTAACIISLSARETSGTADGNAQKAICTFIEIIKRTEYESYIPVDFSKGEYCQAKDE